jgi:hypothetical protein
LKKEPELQGSARVKPPHETVRSARQANFFMIENPFIDQWAKVVGPISIAVYCCLWRHADRLDSTFVGTTKLGEKLNLSARAMQRAIKTLADHKLIRVERTRRPIRRTVYHMLPVPPPAKGVSPLPLFDSIPEQAPVQSRGPRLTSREQATVQAGQATDQARSSLWNKTHLTRPSEQDGRGEGSEEINAGVKLEGKIDPLQTNPRRVRDRRLRSRSPRFTSRIKSSRWRRAT